MHTPISSSSQLFYTESEHVERVIIMSRLKGFLFIMELFSNFDIKSAGVHNYIQRLYMHIYIYYNKYICIYIYIFIHFELNITIDVFHTCDFELFQVWVWMRIIMLIIDESGVVSAP